MCEDEGTRGRDGTAEAARCGISGMGREGKRWVVPVVPVGGGSVDDKVERDDERNDRESSPQPRRRLKGDRMEGDVRRRNGRGSDEREGDGSEIDRSEGD